MAKKNRTELLSSISALAAILDLEAHDKPQRVEIAESALLLKDRIGTVNPINPGAISVDFTSYDLIKSTYAGFPAAFAFEGLTEGDIKFWWLSKDGNGYTSSGVESLVVDQDYLNGTAGEYLFMIVYKGGVTPYLIPLNFTGSFLDKEANGSDIPDVSLFRNSISVYSIAEVTTLLEKTAWASCGRVAPQVEAATFNVKARKQLGVVSCVGRMRITSATTGVLFTLPVSVQPPTIDIPFAAGHASGSDSEVWEFYVKANTRDVYTYRGSGAFEISFNFTYIEG